MWLQMKLARDTKNKKGFYRYVIQDRKVKKNAFPVMSIIVKPVKEWRRRLRYATTFCLNLLWQLLSTPLNRVRTPLNHKSGNERAKSLPL